MANEFRPLAELDGADRGATGSGHGKAVLPGVSGIDVARLGRDLTIGHDELELAQATFNEAATYRVINGWVRAFAGLSDGLRVLDTCSATGLASHLGCQDVFPHHLTLVDIDPGALAKAIVRHRDRYPELVAECTDASGLRLRRRFDLILMNSAYHHIDDERKALFLRHHGDLLDVGGRIIIGDHFLPAHGPSVLEHRQALERFYRPLFDALRQRGTPSAAVAVVEKSFELACRRTVELKVSHDRFVEDVSRAGLRIERSSHIWGSPDESWGTKVVVLSKRA